MSENTAKGSVASQMLSHLRVVDITTPLAYDCGRFFASMGAEVIRVDTSAVQDDAQWSFGNIGKSSIVIDYPGAGRDTFLALIAKCDVLIESFLPGTLAQAGLDYESLAKINPRLIQVSITPFGQNGPYANFKGRELVVAALAGTISQMGEADGEPVREPGNANFFHACGAGIAGALLAERMRNKTGKGQLVDISAQEMGAGRGTVAVIKHQFGDEVPHRNGQSINMGGGYNRLLWPLADGEAFYMEARPGTPGADDMDKWIKEVTGKAVTPSHDMATVEQFLASMTAEQAVEEARKRRIRVMSVSSPEAVAADVQLKARGFYTEQQGEQVPGYFIKVTTGESQ
ncbi:CoA transferase [Alteromonas lipolytica]|uniref:CoA transferase n=1 Tax=Alteromonas lipolytica TaxID=1856405 RepID=A0A1E8FDF3_9ALTE|nr:CaiB/BaiF CoA-transferase family protein [Alteromonas lipolytica]OFI33503.1 hypothetical protein BFC17_04395 [Alteromonas lipolytica]GGF59086.1 hypothetical protein GCM10011338_09210 [Alteromonas lipolytica]